MVATTSSGWRASKAALCALGWLACAACAADDPQLASSPGVASDEASAGATSSGSASSADTSHGEVRNGECTCRGVGSAACPYTLGELCSRYAAGCPAELDIWLSCAEHGQLSEPGRFGYVSKRCDGNTVVYYVFGFGDTVRWVYDASGQLVGAGNDSDAGQSWACGAASPICGAFFSGYESLSTHAGDAGGVAPEPRSDECSAL
jgi:hypothetical protein